MRPAGPSSAISEKLACASKAAARVAPPAKPSSASTTRKGRPCQSVTGKLVQNGWESWVRRPSASTSQVKRTGRAPGSGKPCGPVDTAASPAAGVLRLRGSANITNWPAGVRIARQENNCGSDAKGRKIRSCEAVSSSRAAIRRAASAARPGRGVSGARPRRVQAGVAATTSPSGRPTTKDGRSSRCRGANTGSFSGSMRTKGSFITPSIARSVPLKPFPHARRELLSIPA